MHDKYAEENKKFYNNEIEINSKATRKNKYASSYRKINKYINLIKVDSILDIGCGTGNFSLIVPSEKKYLGIDISNLAINEANRNKKGLHHFINGDFLDMHFNETFDLIICITSIDQFYSRVEALSKIRSLLSKNGKVYIEFRSSSYFLYKIIDIVPIFKRLLRLPPPVSGLEDWSYTQWVDSFTDADFVINKKVTSIRPICPDSFGCFLKGLAALFISVTLPHRYHYMPGFILSKR